MVSSNYLTTTTTSFSEANVVGHGKIRLEKAKRSLEGRTWLEVLVKESENISVDGFAGS